MAFALFWFFFSNTALMRASCCLSALAASFRYSFTLASRVSCSFRIASFVQAILVVMRSYANGALLPRE
uniref:Putative secreted protein n=1 Tax=Anopheles marajoara TaxID=58244 RepID=A0A2M4CF13_9DIPT